MPAISVLVEEPDRSLLGLAKRFYLSCNLASFSRLVSIIDRFMIESVQADGLEHILAAGGSLAKGPALWLLKHDYWYEAAYFPAWLWDRGAPSVKVPTARNLLGQNVLSEIAAWMMKPIFFGVHRTWRDEASSDAEKEAMRRQNRELFERVKAEFYRGQHIMMCPEGTTMSDGRFSEIKPGAYTLAKVERPGAVDLVRCVPVGLTYDYLAGDSFLGLKRNLFFLNIGKEMFYEPVRRFAGEPDKDYVKRDIAKFSQRILDSFIDLNTYTVSQLAGDYLVSLAERGGGKTSHAELEQVVASRADALSALGMTLDKALLTEAGRQKRVARFIKGLVSGHYIEKDGGLNIDRVLLPPDLGSWTKHTTLMYSVNRLRHIMEQRPDVAEAIGRA